MFTQDDEEKYILGYFSRHEGKRFLDIGANDGRYLSATRALAQQGWGGVCVEPSPEPFLGLYHLYDADPKVKIINCAVSLKSEIIPFYHASGVAVSTTEPEHRDFWEKRHVRYGEYFIKTATVDEILDCFGDDYDFICMDIEGADYELFCALPFKRLGKLRMICVEFTDVESLILTEAKKHGFELYHKTRHNLLLVRNIDGELAAD